MHKIPSKEKIAEMQSANDFFDKYITESKREAEKAGFTLEVEDGNTHKLMKGKEVIVEAVYEDDDLVSVEINDKEAVAEFLKYLYMDEGDFVVESIESEDADKPAEKVTGRVSYDESNEFDDIEDDFDKIDESDDDDTEFTDQDITESKITSASEFKDYADNLLKEAHGDSYDNAIATKTIDELLEKYGDDFGAAVGALTSNFGE